MRIPRTPPNMAEMMKSLEIERVTELLIEAGVGQFVNSDYVHYEKLRFLEPPNGLSTDEWWLAIKFARMGGRKSLTDLRPVAGSSFSYLIPDPALELLHRIDTQASGSAAMPEAVANASTRDRYLFNSLLEEAITSSQLEGAATTRQQAKDMIRSGRAPRDRHEQMILNNFNAMLFARSVADAPLTPEIVFEVHRIITDKTLDDEAAAGRLQGPADERVVVDDQDGQVLHTPPAADELPERLELMCAFANGELDRDGYVHPVIRAIVLHFWLAYDHPFVDGNGRTARALFYWSMLKSGYWLVEYLSISRILREAPVQYGTSFLQVATDENDLTYFIMYQLKVIDRALDEMHEYLAAKVAEIHEVESLVGALDLNHRQLALLGRALRHPGSRYTYRSHATTNRVSRQTSRTDLLELESLGLLRKRRAGREVSFLAVGDLPDALRAVDGADQ
ncbi:MAG: Fic family protein [Actinomycetia bacterium]|nr:Fic family protein [Actinomycetes bacterium]